MKTNSPKLNPNDFTNAPALAQEQIMSALNARKNGQIFTLVYKSEKISSNKTGNQRLNKITVMQVQIGCDYYHTPEGMQSLIEHNGEKHARYGLTEIEKDKIYANSKGDLYISVYPLKNGYGSKVMLLNDVITSEAELADTFPESFYKSHSDSGTLTLKMSGILYMA